jgi:excisionase family DNA binding protein
MLKTRAGKIVGSGAPGLFPGQTEQDVLLSREEVAAYLRVSLPTLELWARNGDGPRVVRVGRAIRYRLVDVRQFVEAGASPTAAVGG